VTIRVLCFNAARLTLYAGPLTLRASYIHRAPFSIPRSLARARLPPIRLPLVAVGIPDGSHPFFAYVHLAAGRQTPPQAACCACSSHAPDVARSLCLFLPERARISGLTFRAVKHRTPCTFRPSIRRHVPRALRVARILLPDEHSRWPPRILFYLSRHLLTTPCLTCLYSMNGLTRCHTCRVIRSTTAYYRRHHGTGLRCLCHRHDALCGGDALCFMPATTWFY